MVVSLAAEGAGRRGAATNGEIVMDLSCSIALRRGIAEKAVVPVR